MITYSCRKSDRQEIIPQKEIRISISSLLFDGELDKSNSLTQEINGVTRILTPLKSSAFNKGYRYKIIENNKNTRKTISGYIISKDPITKYFNFFILNIDSKGILINKNKNESSSTKNDKTNIVAKTNFKNKIVQSLLGEELTVLAGCNSIPPICIDWYWTTFDPYTGSVVGEVYMYTSCYDPCTFTSGGSAAEITATCNQLSNAMQSGPVSIDGTRELISETSNERSFIYSWTFEKQHDDWWLYKSYETGVHQKTNGVWKWKSLTHNSVSRSGFTIGASIDCQVNTALPQVGIYFAGMQLSYTLLASAICSGSPITNNKSRNGNSPIWHVNYTPPQN